MIFYLKQINFIISFNDCVHLLFINRQNEDLFFFLIELSDSHSHKNTIHLKIVTIFFQYFSIFFSFFGCFHYSIKTRFRSLSSLGTSKSTLDALPKSLWDKEIVDKLFYGLSQSNIKILDLFIACLVSSLNTLWLFVKEFILVVRILFLVIIA